MNPFIYSDDTPIVYISGVCEIVNNKKWAVYGVCWGNEDFRNTSGKAPGLQCEIRAELSAIRQVMRMAVSENIQKLIIRTTCTLGYEEMEKFEKSKMSKKNFPCYDLLKDIKQVIDTEEEKKIWIEHVEKSPEIRMAYQLAIREIPNFRKPEVDDSWEKFEISKPIENVPIRLESSPESEKFDSSSPPSLSGRSQSQAPCSSESEFVPSVSIFGVCQSEGQQNPQAAFGVFWGKNDPKNETGRVSGVQTSLRASISALRTAFQTATDRNIQRILVKTRRIEIESIMERIANFDERENANSKNGDLILECRELFQNLDVSIDVFPKNIENLDLDEAKKLADMALTKSPPVNQNFSVKETEKKSPSAKKIEKNQDCTTVTIIGKKFRVSGKERLIYAVYWGENDERNECAVLEEEQAPLLATVTALKAALKTAASQNLRRLKVITDEFKLNTWFDKLPLKTKSAEIAKIGMECLNEMEKFGFWKNYVTFDCHAKPEEFDGIRKFYMRRIPEILRETKKNCEESGLNKTMSMSRKEETISSPSQLLQFIQIPIANVGGACRNRGTSNASAVFSVYWENGDLGSSQGPVSGVVNNLRAKITAVKKAMEMALQANILSIIVRTNDQMVFDTINSKNSPIGNEDLMAEIVEMTKKFENLNFDFNRSEWIDVADHLAETIINHF